MNNYQYQNQYLIEKHFFWIAFCFACTSACIQLIFFKKIAIDKIIFSFFILWTGYNFYVLSIKNYLKKGAIIILSIPYILYFLITEFHNYSFYYLLVGISISSLYQFPFTKIAIRNIPYCKVFFIAFIWSFWLIYINFSVFNWGGFYVFFLYVLGITLPFDIRDFSNDTIKTIPHLLGISYTWSLSNVFLLLSLILAFFFIPDPFYYLVVILIIITVNQYARKTNKQFPIGLVYESFGILLFFLYGLRLFFR